LNI
jgi:hypothetical protein